jgi:LacI family transcriptional regulator
MPSGPNPFMRQILDGLAEMSGWMLARRIGAEIVTTDVFDPEALASTLETLPENIDGVAVVALDHPRVRVAIDDLVRSRKQVVTLVSDVPASQRHHYVGIDNIAAGRTAGALLGGLLGQRAGRVALVAGSQNLRDHAERILGFRQVISAEFPRLEVLPVAEGRDDDDCSEGVTAMTLSENKDVIGLYNVGAGTPGVAKALIDSGRAGEVVFVGHDLTELTRRLLTRGAMAAVISQNPSREAYAAVRVLLALARGEPILQEQEKIGIEIIMRDNMP